MDTGDFIYLIVMGLCGYWITGAFIHSYKERKKKEDDSSNVPPPHN